MPYHNPRITAYMDGLLKAPSDATARPMAQGSGVKDALRVALRKLAEWDTKVGRELAGRMPDGTSLQQGSVPDWISGPKGVAKLASRVGNPTDALTALKRTGPFDAAHALEMGKVRAMGYDPHEMPDLLDALIRAKQ